MLSAAEKKSQKHKAPAEKKAEGGPQSKAASANPIWQQLATQLSPGSAQARLRVGAAGDPSEREADRVADEVVRTPPGGSQGKCAACASGAPPCPKCESEARELQRKAASASFEPESAPASLLDGLGAGRPLEPEARLFFEPRFGRDFGDVRVHTDAQAADSAKSLGARAFTYGNHIAFAANSYDPSSDAGRRLLAHEITHVLQQPGHIARDPDDDASAASRRCRTGMQAGAAHAYPDNHARWPSGAYSIWGPPYAEESAADYGDLSIQAWIIWRFGTVSPAVSGRIRAEATNLSWSWSGPSPQRGCQYTTAISIADMNRLVALASRDPAARSAETRETGAGMPALPPPAPIPDYEIVVTAGPGATGGGSSAPTPVDRQAEAERALDPTSIYEAGAPGSNLPPFPARMDGPEMEVPRGIGTYSMALDYAAVTSDPLVQIALHMSIVNYYWELFDISGIVRAGLGRGMEEEARRVGQTTAPSATAASAAGGSTGQRVANAYEQLSEETIRSWEELRDPRRAAEGGSAVDVVTRSLANELNLYLLPASAIVAAGGQVVSAISDLLGAYSREREIAFPNREGFYMVRCIAQPAPRGPNRSEIRAASVRTKIVEVRNPETLARNALDMPEALIAEREARKAMTSDAAETRRLDEEIARIREQSSGDIVTYLTHVIADKERERDAAPSWRRADFERELESLRLRLEQARRSREGTAGDHHRPRAAFTSVVTGDTYPLMLELSEVSVGTGFRVRLTDLTVPDRAPIERNGASREQAVRNAFNELAFHGDLGRGQLVVRMPPSWTGEPRELSLQTGDASTAIVRRRLQDLATALLVLSIAVPGVGEISAVIAAGLAVERLISRGLNGTLRLDAESVSDTLAILGAVAQGAQLIGRLRIVRAGDSFVAAVREGDVAAIEAAVNALDAARRAGRILDATSTITNVGGLLWGDAQALRRLARIQQDELDGRITHADARHQRADILAAAVRDHGIMLAGAMRPTGADRASGVEPRVETTPPPESGAPPEGARPPEGTPPVEGARRTEGTPPPTGGAHPPEGAPPAEGARTGEGAPRPAETIPEAELERRAAQSSAPTTGAPSAEPLPEGVRTRFRTPDQLHEIYVLNDGRIMRCSASCAQLRTWYDSYLKSQPEGTRRHEANRLDGLLQGLEQRAAAGENTPALNQEIGSLDTSIREFIAHDVAAELQRGFEGRGLVESDQTLLTTEQAHTLLRVFNVDSLTEIAHAAESANQMRALVDVCNEVLQHAAPAEVVRMRHLLERLMLNAEQLDPLLTYFEARRDRMPGAIGDLEAAQDGAQLQRIAQRDPVIPVGIDAGVANAVDSMLIRFNTRRVRIDAGLRSLLREHLQNNPTGIPVASLETIADARGLLTALRAAATSRVPSTATAPTARDPRYGHAMSGHGSGNDPQTLMSRAATRRGDGVPQGQFYNDATMVEADALAPAGDGEQIIDLGRPIGRVFMPDGTVISDVTRVLVFRRNGGTFFDAYPVDPGR